MRKMMTVWMGLAAMAATVALAAPVAGEGEDLGESEGRERMHQKREHSRASRMEHLTEVLELTAQQVEEWTEIHEAQREAMEGRERPVRGHDHLQKIEEMASADEPDAAAIGELVIEAHRAREAAMAEHEAFQAELMAILTPEQQARFETMKKMRGEFGERSRRGPRRRMH